MANKLAGQRAKFTKAYADYYSTEDEEKRRRAVQLMSEVVAGAQGSGFSATDVTGGREPPAEVQRLTDGAAWLPQDPIDPDKEVRELVVRVDTSEAVVEGVGDQAVYAYGYKCAPGRLKVGSTTKDVIERIAGQISTSTPDKPSLYLTLRTHNCRALEMAMHGIMRVRHQAVVGGGDEWFMVTTEELLAIYRMISPVSLERSCDQTARYSPLPPA